MCDQDHFEDDDRSTRRAGWSPGGSSASCSGAGVAMLLPKVANAVAVTESDVTIKTPDGTADCYFVHPATGTAAGRADLAGHLRAAAGVPPDGQAARRVRLLGARGQSVLSRQEGADRAERARHADPGADAARAGAERDDAHDGCEGVRRLARPAAVGEQEPEGRHAGLLHGRSDRVPHGRSGARPRRRRRLVPRRRARRPTQPNSPHLQAAKTKAQFLIAIAENDDKRAPNEKNVLKETFAKAKLPAEIEVYAGARTAGARRIRRSTTNRRPRKPGPPARAVRQGAGLI